eukprot:TRINITY_DN119326_c0_g1_i1.p1 TRINITY_DN119326_c0_g1~~TRINITY_DN119326_c0_g1_i1.p1  ORF type:complete len:101 (-),score=8.45 TRINITY_DN119326_c0_g1_i1:73-375(-)
MQHYPASLEKGPFLFSGLFIETVIVMNTRSCTKEEEIVTLEEAKAFAREFFRKQAERARKKRKHATKESQGQASAKKRVTDSSNVEPLCDEQEAHSSGTH